MNQLSDIWLIKMFRKLYVLGYLLYAQRMTFFLTFEINVMFMVRGYTV